MFNRRHEKMKQTITDYMDELTSDNLEAFERIISLQYRKFIRFYRLVEEHSKDISDVKYEFTSPSSLDVVLIIEDTSKVKDIKSDIKSSMKTSDYEGTVTLDDNTIHISIVMEEEDVA